MGFLLVLGAQPIGHYRGAPGAPLCLPGWLDRLKRGDGRPGAPQCKGQEGRVWGSGRAEIAGAGSGAGGQATAARPGLLSYAGD
jgi:hypothetical protein